MSLKSAFNWVKQRLGAQPPAPDHITFNSTVHAKTKDDIFVAIPITLDMKVAKQKEHVLGIDPKHQASLVVEMAVRAEVTGITYADLLKPPEGFADKIILSTRQAVLTASGLDLLGVQIKKAQGPAMLAEMTAAIERAHAENMAAVEKARQEVKELVDAHTSAQGLMKGLDNEIQVKKPLSLKKSGQQP